MDIGSADAVTVALFARVLKPKDAERGCRSPEEDATVSRFRDLLGWEIPGDSGFAFRDIGMIGE